MRLPLRSALVPVLSGLLLMSCTEAPTAPQSMLVPLGSSNATTPPSIVISQVYGGGGNSGATLKNDFIEIFNASSAPIDVSGWSVQYASATGSSWSVTALSGTIPSGGYQLIQEAAGSGGTVSLPAPDASGGITMAAGSGKVILVSAASPASGTCPTAGVVDFVSFGSSSSNCGFGNTPTLSNTTAAIRGDQGCAVTNVLGDDFTSGTPNPRNSASPAHVCGGTTPLPATVTITPDSQDVNSGASVSFAAAAQDAASNPVGTTFSWSSSDNAIATVDASGTATGVAEGKVKIRATTPNGVFAEAVLKVVAPPPPPPAIDVVISQVYAGGGNSGAPYTNDYVELFNHGTSPADVSGYKIFYTSATGTTWTQSFTIPANSPAIAPGHYFLVQMAAGSGSPAPLPTPDAAGTLAMGASAGKVVFTQPNVVLSTPCPTGAGVVDRVGYGTSSSCGATWGGTTANASNTTAAFRKNDGCVNTGNVGNDWVVLAPVPRNSSMSKNCTQPARTQSTYQVAINELMADPANAENASWGQWFEVYNYGSTPVNLKNWTIISDGTLQPDHVINADVIVQPGGFAVLGRGADVTRNGGVVEDYNYFTGTSSTIWLDNSDYLMLVDEGGARVDSVAWTSVPHGVTKALKDASLIHTDADGPSWGYSTTTFGDGDYGTPGAPNAPLADTPPFVSPNTITVSGRVATDAPLPVGFEAQLFATEFDATNTAIPTTFTWSSLTPGIATIDARGVIHAEAPGTARFRVVAADGASRVHALTMITPVASATAQYGNNTEFGTPTAGGSNDDYFVQRPQYTSSWNGSLGTPNWVAYDLNGTHITPGQDRCNCFTFDPVLETAGFTKYTTADYTGAGGFAGYGIDRGHMTRSFDRTAGTLDNANTFLFSNVVPQYSEVNQGPWSVLEDSLGRLATAANKEVYIYVGPAGSLGSVKNEGKINNPAYTWKVALVLPRGAGLASVHDYRDVEDVIAVIMPNQPTAAYPNIRNTPWTAFEVTVDSVERLTGYDFLNALPAKVQAALESNTKPPLAFADGPYTGNEAAAISMSGAASVDPNGTIVSYAWDFGDGQAGTGASVSHAYATYGTYTVHLTVTDNDGLTDELTTTATVSNVAPSVAAFSGASLLTGETYTASGSFTDPGSEPWTASVDYGDGSSGALALSGKTFALSHTYNTAGTFTVTVTVSDGSETGTSTATVTVLTASQALGNLAALVADISSLQSKLQNAQASADRGSNGAAVNQVEAFKNEVNAMLRSRRMTSERAAALLAEANRIIASLGGTVAE